LWQAKPKTMQVQVNGELGQGVTSKDLILAIIAKYGINVGTGHIFEYTGEAIRKLTMEQRMTVCNMSIEAGAKAGLISPDETTFAYLEGRPHVPTGDEFEQLKVEWRELATDPDASYDAVIEIDASEIEPVVTWGTNPGMGVGVNGLVPRPEDAKTDAERAEIEKALEYMGLEGGTKMTDIEVQYVFIGSCTNSRIEDLRAASEIVAGKKVNSGVNAIVVPGSHSVKKQAESEGLDKIFLDAGFEWRESGCSMCLAMNADQVPAGMRCASTSNRNFEGRQGNGSRTHLVSPAMAAAAAIAGRFVDVRTFKQEEALV